MESHHIESFGVVVELVGPGSLHTLLADHLPGLRDSGQASPDLTFEVRERRGGDTILGYEIWRADGSVLTRAREREAAAQALANHLHFEIASRASEYVFVHAGVVGWHGRAIVLPGRSMSGKTSLVAQLLRHGATYYSDEYAVLDHDGLVHPYARQLRVRAADRTAQNQDPRELTTRIGTAPIPLGMIAVLRFEDDAALQVEEISSGAAALALIDNTVRVRDEPASSVRAASAAGDAVNLEGVRGESEEAAAMLLDRAARAFSRR